MSNLPNNTTIDGKKIISESENNDHRHDSSQILGLSDSAIGDSFIYAELIDGVSYSDMQNTFISNSNNTMGGTLNISTSSNNENNIINVFELESLKVSNNIIEYSISDIPLTEETNTSVQSIMVSGAIPSIDLSWTPSTVGSTTSSISMTGPSQVVSNNSYDFEITNFNSFDTYSVVVSSGSSSIDTTNGLIVYNSPLTAPNGGTINMTVTNTTKNVTKNISFELVEDDEMFLSYYDGNDYVPIDNNTLTMTEPSGIMVRIDTFNPNYTYNFSSTIPDLNFTQNSDIITISAPSTNNQELTGTVTISRQSSSASFNIIVENFNIGWNLQDIAYDNKSYSTLPLTPRGIWISDDGVDLYVCDPSVGDITHSTMTTEYDVSTASLYETAFYFDQFNAYPQDLQINSSSNRMYVLESNGVLVEYSISSGRPATANQIRQVDLKSIISSAYNFTAFQITDEGNKLFVAGNDTNNYIFRLDLSTAWNISTSSYSNNNYQASANSITGLSVKPDGSSFIFVDLNESLSQIGLSTNWDLLTASNIAGSSIIENEDDNEGGIFVPLDGKKLYYGGTSTDTIYQYSIVMT